MLWFHRNKKNIFIFILIILFCIPAVLSLFNPGFFQSDDGEWMIIRFSAFHEALRDGQIPVRFLSRLNHGYGYPVANFLYPGFMYLAEPIHLLGFGFVDTIKIIFGISMVGSAVLCYLWLSKFFDKSSSLVGSLVYLYTPYHLFDLYKRGSVGEVLALAVVPFILWQIERKSLFWSAIGIAFLVLAHNTLAVLFLPIIIIYKLLSFFSEANKKHLILNTLYLILISLGLSAFFWIPAFFELKYTVFSETQVSEWQKYFSDIDLIGISTFIVLLLTIILFITGIMELTKHRLTALLLAVGILSLFFASKLSNPLWHVLPVSFVQFPFRFLSITILSTAFLSAFIVNKVKNSNKRLLVGLILVVILWFSATPFMKPSIFFDKGEGFYSTNEATTTVHNEYMPKWVKEKPIDRFKEKVEIVEGVGTVENISYNSKKITFNVEVKDNMKLRINTIYYPGWKVIVNNQSTEFDYSNEKGVMELNLPKGESKVELKFSATPLRLFADLLSLFSFIALMFFVIAFSPNRLKVKARNIEVAKLFHL